VLTNVAVAALVSLYELLGLRDRHHRDPSGELPRPL
jgi:hypothetical protein